MQCQRSASKQIENVPSSLTIDDKPSAIKPEEQAVQTTEEIFDPYDYGSEDGVGWWGAAVHIFRNTIGIGILLMPYLMKNLGYVGGTLLMVGLSLVYYHTVHTLISVEYRLCKMLRVPHLSLVSVADHTFQQAPPPHPTRIMNKANVFVRLLIYFYYGIPVGNVTFLIVIAANVQQMAKYFGIRLQPTYIMSLLIVPLTLFCLHKRILKMLLPFSSVTNICTLLMMAIVVGCSICGPKAPQTCRAFGDIAFVPQGMATFILAIRCTGIIIPLKNDMVRPRELSAIAGSLNISGLTIALLYTSFGLISYLNYGDQTEENIFRNLPADGLVSFAIYLLFTVALVVGYVLGFFVRFQTVWCGTLEESLADSKYKTVVKYGIRIAINAVAYLLAVGCPQLSLISAISGTAGIVVEIALPSVLQQLLTASVTMERCRWLMAKDALIIVVSGVIFIMSSVRCVNEIKKLYSE